MEGDSDAEVRCALCTLLVRRSGVESHLRRELAYFAFECGLCGHRFAAAADAAAHFSRRFSPHFGRPPLIIEAPDSALDDRLEGLMDQMLGPPDMARSKSPPLPTSPTTPTPLESMDAECPLTQFNFSSAAITAEKEAKGEEEAEDEEPEENVTILGEEGEDVKMGGLLPPSGLVACLLCSKPIGKSYFRHHALYVHTELRLYSCSLCSASFKSRGAVKYHQGRAHSVTTSSETFTCAMDEAKAELDDVVRNCFGEVKGIAMPRYNCSACHKDVGVNMILQHVVSGHLKQVVFQCGLCAFKSYNWYAHTTLAHIRKRHKMTRPEEHLESHKERLVPIAKAKARLLFGYNARG